MVVGDNFVERCEIRFGKLERFLPHGLADDAAVRSALLRRVWVFTFVDLVMRKE